MKADDLRASILQAAIQGKLTKQDPNDEPASVLVERIRDEKHRLVGEGKIKRDKNESFIFKRDGSWFETINGKDERCIDDEIPFEIPDYWGIIRFSNLFQFIDYRGFTPTKVSEGVRLITATNIKKGYFDNTSKDYITESEYLSRLQRGTTQKGDLLFTTEAPLGNSCICPLDRCSCGQRIITLHPFLSVSVEFYNFVIQSPFFEQYIRSVRTGTTVYGIKSAVMKEMYLPLPPVEEQFRIVDYLKILLDKISDYRNVESSLTKIENDVSDKFRSSVLNNAVQGKLTKQDPNDEPASVLVERIRDEKHRLVREGKIKRDKNESFIFKRDGSWFETINGKDERCIDDEIPFDIPENWNWARVYSICSMVRRGKSPVYSNIEQYPVLAQKCNQNDGLYLDRCLFIDPDTISKYSHDMFLQDGDCLINSTGLGTLGRIGIYDSSLNKYECMVADSHITVIRPLISSRFMLYYLKSPIFQDNVEDLSSGSTKQKELQTETVKQLLIPIPPIEEQTKVIDVIDKLLIQCNSMRRLHD